MIGNKGSQVIFIDDSEFTSSTDIDININEPQVSIFPNPTNDLVNFENINGQQYDVSITNQIGSQYKETISENSINMSHYSPGVYIIKLTDPSGRKSKFIKVVKI